PPALPKQNCSAECRAAPPAAAKPAGRLRFAEGPAADNSTAAGTCHCADYRDCGTVAPVATRRADKGLPLLPGCAATLASAEVVAGPAGSPKAPRPPPR